MHSWSFREGPIKRGLARQANIQRKAEESHPPAVRLETLDVLTSPHATGDILTISCSIPTRTHTSHTLCHIAVQASHLSQTYTHPFQTHAALLMYLSDLDSPSLMLPPLAMPSLVISSCTSPCLPPPHPPFFPLRDWSFRLMAQCGTSGGHPGSY